MSDVLHRTTKLYRQSANTPDFPIVDWIHSPDLSAIAGFGSKYWIITGDVITLMDQAARDAVDAAEATAQKDAVADGLDRTNEMLPALAKALLDEINILRAAASLPARTGTELKAAVRSKL